MRKQRTALGVAAAVLAIGITAAPAAAGAPVITSWSDTYQVQHDCGIVETTTVTARERAIFVDGTWVRSSIQFRFDGIFTGPTGETYAATSHQNGTFTPEIGRLSGQGTFLRGAGGVLLMDTGRLVFFLDTGETIHASAMVGRFDDPDFPGSVEAALCARLG